MSTTLPGEIDVVFLIADLSGYAALTEAHGGGHAATVVRRYVELAEAALPPTARLVERVGDELLITGGDIAEMVLTSVRLRAAVESEPRFPTLRAGLHAGSVLEQDGRYFGTPLNLAARVAGYARPGQILCTDRIVASGRRPEGVDYRPLSRVRLKNISGLVELYEVIAGSPADDTMSVVDGNPCHIEGRKPAQGRVIVLVIGLSLVVGLVGVLASRVGLGSVSARGSLAAWGIVLLGYVLETIRGKGSPSGWWAPSTARGPGGPRTRTSRRSTAERRRDS